MNFYTLNRLLLAMKLTTILVFAVILQTSAAGYAQRLTLNTKNEPLEHVFKTISKQSGYDFVYNDFDLRGLKVSSLQLNNVSLENGLQACLEGQDLSYLIKDKTIIIKRKEKSLFSKLSDLIGFAGPVKGVVIDENGHGLPGAVIRIKGGQRISNTNNDGEFIINVPEGTVLEISYIGYKIQEAVVTKGTTKLSISLSPDISKLDEISVEGYRKGSQRLATSNISKISGDELMKQPVSNPLQALEGRIPGMVVSQVSGVPGARLNVQIRGRANFDKNLTSDQPLFILDGVPMAAGNDKVNLIGGPFGPGTTDGLSAFAGINTADIESIDVLKDADATAIYGSRGANGVILITTRKGKAGKMRLNANVTSGVSTVTRMAKMLNTEQYIAMRKEAFANDKITPTNSNAYDLKLWDNNRYTDFTDLLVGNNAHTNDAQLTLSGGSKSTQYRIGGAYHKEGTVWPGDMSSDRGSFNLNIHNTSQDERFTMDLSALYGTNQSNLTALDLASAVVLPPNFKLYDENGKLAWNEGNLYIQKDNPLATLNQVYLSKMSNINANLVLNYKLLKNLDIRSSFGYNMTQNDEKRLTPLSAQNPMASNLSGFSSFGNNQLKNWIIEPQAEYTGNIGKGKLNVLLGGTFNQRSTAGLVVNAKGYTSDELIGSLSGASSTGITASNTASVYRYQAVFGRINYNWEDKYIVNFTGRRDGSSRFGPDYRFSNFGAIGAAWVFSNEAPLKDNKVLSYGKLRGSYGSTGNDQIGEYQYLDAWVTAGNYADSATLYPKKLYSPDLHWERNKKLEIGIELGFFKDRILFTGSVYQNISSDPLVFYGLPKITGFSTIVRNLDGVEVQNRGLELTLTSYNFRKRPLTWTTDFNITLPQNKLKKYPDLEKSTYFNSYAIGQSLNRIFAAQFTGVDPATGLYTVKDVNGDNQATTADYGVIGSLDPTFYGGISNNFSYKRFNLSFFLQFTKQLGRDWRTNNLYNPPGSAFNVPELVLSRWQNPGDITDVQKFTTTQGAIYGTAGFYPYSFSGGSYTDASFIRLRNVYLSYDIPVKWLSVVHINSCKFYVQGQNLFLISGYKGGDPETQNYTRMSPLRTITGGLQLTL